MKKNLQSDIGRRLEQYRKKAGYSRNAVADHKNITFSRTTLQAWETGEREASLSGIYELAQLYSVTPELLLFDDDRRVLPDYLQVSETSDYNYVPFYRAEASAGHGSFTDGHRKPTHHLAFRKRWIAAKGFHLKDLVGLVVSGDSMEPTIRDGAAIIINTARNEAMDGNIYVIRMSDRLWVKRTQWLPSGGLRLISDNKMYSSLDFSEKDFKHDDIEVIGQVVHTAYDLVK